MTTDPLADVLVELTMVSTDKEAEYWAARLRDAGVEMGLRERIEAALVADPRKGNVDRWRIVAALAAARENKPSTTAEIAAQEGLKPESLRQALRESHPDASPSEVIGRAHDIEENT